MFGRLPWKYCLEHMLLQWIKNSPTALNTRRTLQVTTVPPGMFEPISDYKISKIVYDFRYSGEANWSKMPDNVNINLSLIKLIVNNNYEYNVLGTHILLLLYMSVIEEVITGISHHWVRKSQIFSINHGKFPQQYNTSWIT